MREDGRGVPVEEECASDPSTHTRWFRKRLLAWFKLGGRSFPWREPFRIPYEVVVAEILLQRTTANGVARAYPVFLERYPSWEVLSRASLERLQEDLRPLGLWRQKAAVFRSLARSIEEGGGRVPASRQELERLRGVGQYTASAILAVVYGRAEPLVDANAARVLGRFFGPQTFSDIGRDPARTRATGGARQAEPAGQLGHPRFRGTGLPSSPPTLSGVSPASQMRLFRHRRPTVMLGRLDFPFTSRVSEQKHRKPSCKACCLRGGGTLRSDHPERERGHIGAR